MPRDNDKNNDSRGRRDRPSGGKGRSGAARGPEKKFAKRSFEGKDFAGKRDGERRPYAGKPDGAKSYGKKPYAGPGKPYAGKREGARAALQAGTTPHTAFTDRASRAKAKSVPTLRAASAATRVLPGGSRTRNSATSGPIARVKPVAKSDPTPPRGDRPEQKIWRRREVFPWRAGSQGRPCRSRTAQGFR